MKENILDAAPDYKFLNACIDNIKDIEKKTMLDVVKEIYEKTYYRYAILFHQEKFKATEMRELMLKKSQKVNNLMIVCESLLDSAEKKQEVDADTLEKLQEIYEENKETV